MALISHPQFARLLNVAGTVKFMVLSLITLVLGVMQQGEAQGITHAAHNKALVSRSFDAWKAGTGSPFDLLAEDASWTIAGNSVVSKTYPTRESFLGAVIRPFNARLAGRLTPAVHKIYADEDAVVIYFDADATARDGKPYHNSYAWFFDLQNDKVIRAVAFLDSVEFNAFWLRVTPDPAAR